LLICRPRSLGGRSSRKEMSNRKKSEELQFPLEAKGRLKRYFLLGHRFSLLLPQASCLF
jgi:hypothetical protein